MAIPLDKWLVMALLTILSIFLGLIPYMMVRRRKYLPISLNSSTYKVILTMLSCFGAGVLFSTSMLHLLPEVRESFAEIPSVWTTFDKHFPLAEVVVICGFCLIYIVEEVAHFIMVDGHHGHHHHINTVARHNSIAHGVPIPNVKGSTASRGSIVNHLPTNPSICITVPDEEEGKKEGDQHNKMSSITDSTGTSMEEEQCPDDNSNFATSLRTFLALIALSFHAIMEGVAIGLQVKMTFTFLFWEKVWCPLNNSWKFDFLKSAFLSFFGSYYYNFYFFDGDILSSFNWQAIFCVWHLHNTYILYEYVLQSKGSRKGLTYLRIIKNTLTNLGRRKSWIFKMFFFSPQDSTNVWVMFGAIASHKFVISFCMGMELVASQTKVLTYLFSIIFFAVISPVGIIIGSLLASDDSTQSVPVTVIEVRKSKIYSLDRASIYWDTHYYSTTFYSILWVSSIDKMNCECSLFTSRD